MHIVPDYQDYLLECDAPIPVDCMVHYLDAMLLCTVDGLYITNKDGYYTLRVWDEEGGAIAAIEHKGYGKIIEKIVL